MVAVLRTDRLILRDWREEDLDAFAALNADPRVMAHFPAPLSREESDAGARSIRTALARDGHGLWAVEAPGEANFIGFVGLARPAMEAHFTPCVEIGWRLAYAQWGKGYATEAARAAEVNLYSTREPGLINPLLAAFTARAIGGKRLTYRSAGAASLA